VDVLTDDEEVARVLEENRPLIGALARVERLELKPQDAPRPAGCATAVAAGAVLSVPLKGLIDVAAERARLEKDKGRLAKQIAGSKKKLDNEKFLGKAPAEVVEKERTKLAEGEDRLSKIEEALVRLNELEQS
jgi:valyl-tRNA synthetase